MRRSSLVVLALLFLHGCDCGFVPVEECFPTCADGDGGTRPVHDGGAVADAGHAPDAGAVDPGTTEDAGTTQDAGTTEDAGTTDDAGTTQDAGAAPDAGSMRDAGCAEELAWLVAAYAGDYVHVTGQAGVYGAVDFIIGGNSAGASSYTGIQRFTNSFFVKQGLPAAVNDIELWMWTYGLSVSIGKEYVADNDRRQLPVPFIDFRISPGVDCPMGLGQGTFTFTRFAPIPTTATPVEGVYDFHCPDAGLEVHGCFLYAP